MMNLRYGGKTMAIILCFLFIVIIIEYSRYTTNLYKQSSYLTEFATGANVKEECHTLERRLPKCIIIGVRKAGTFTLLHFLNIHPDIVIPEFDFPKQNEMHFFNKDNNYRKGLEFYRKSMPLSKSNQIPIEKTPTYFNEWKVPSRVYQMNSSVRLLLIVRNPVQRTLSGYLQDNPKRKKTAEEFKSLVLDGQGSINKSYKPVNISTYHAHFSEWLKYFPRDQIHIVDGDNFVKNPYEELYSIETFLGIRHVISNKNLIFDKDKGFFCPLDENNKTYCMPSHKGRQHPDVEPEVLEKLKNYFEPLNEMFFDLSGRRFDWR